MRLTEVNFQRLRPFKRFQKLLVALAIGHLTRDWVQKSRDWIQKSRACCLKSRDGVSEFVNPEFADGSLVKRNEMNRHQMWTGPKNCRRSRKTNFNCQL